MVTFVHQQCLNPHTLFFWCWLSFVLMIPHCFSNVDFWALSHVLLHTALIYVSFCGPSLFWVHLNLLLHTHTRCMQGGADRDRWSEELLTRLVTTSYIPVNVVKASKHVLPLRYKWQWLFFVVVSFSHTCSHWPQLQLNWNYGKHKEKLLL